jgi:hypothetical protein
LIYWPASCWHIAESDGSSTMTISLPLLMNQHPSRSSPFALAANAAQTRHDPRPNGAKDAMLSIGLTAQGFDNNQVGRALATSVARFEAEARAVIESGELEDEYLRWFSAFGFTDVPEARDCDLGEEDEIAYQPLSGLVWRELPDGDMAVCANGHILICEAKYLGLLEHIKAAPPQRLSVIAATFAHEAGASHLEREEVIGAIHTLASIGAVEKHLA